MLLEVSTGVRLDSVEFGDPGSYPLLLLCGSAHSYVLWTEFAQALAARHRVICYDHRGIGNSERGQGPLSVAGLAEDAAALLDALGIARAHVLGWSLGSAAPGGSIRPAWMASSRPRTRARRRGGGRHE
jgi:pimeloyl-ACP methyl ester carboxylesterase